MPGTSSKLYLALQTARKPIKPTCSGEKLTHLRSKSRFSERLGRTIVPPHVKSEGVVTFSYRALYFLELSNPKLVFLRAPHLLRRSLIGETIGTAYTLQWTDRTWISPHVPWEIGVNYCWFTISKRRTQHMVETENQRFCDITCMISVSVRLARRLKSKTKTSTVT